MRWHLRHTLLLAALLVFAWLGVAVLHAPKASAISSGLPDNSDAYFGVPNNRARLMVVATGDLKSHVAFGYLYVPASNPWFTLTIHDASHCGGASIFPAPYHAYDGGTAFGTTYRVQGVQTVSNDSDGNNVADLACGSSLQISGNAAAVTTAQNYAMGSYYELKFQADIGNSNDAIFSENSFQLTLDSPGGWMGYAGDLYNQAGSQFAITNTYGDSDAEYINAGFEFALKCGDARGFPGGRVPAEITVYDDDYGRPFQQTPIHFELRSRFRLSPTGAGYGPPIISGDIADGPDGTFDFNARLGLTLQEDFDYFIVFSNIWRQNGVQFRLPYKQINGYDNCGGDPGSGSPSCNIESITRSDGNAVIRPNDAIKARVHVSGGNGYQLGVNGPTADPLHPPNEYTGANYLLSGQPPNRFIRSNVISGNDVTFDMTTFSYDAIGSNALVAPGAPGGYAFNWGVVLPGVGWRPIVCPGSFNVANPQPPSLSARALCNGGLIRLILDAYDPDSAASFLINVYMDGQTNANIVDFYNSGHTDKTYPWNVLSPDTSHNFYFYAIGDSSGGDRWIGPIPIEPPGRCAVDAFSCVGEGIKGEAEGGAGRVNISMGVTNTNPNAPPPSTSTWNRPAGGTGATFQFRSPVGTGPITSVNPGVVPPGGGYTYNGSFGSPPGARIVAFEWWVTINGNPNFSRHCIGYYQFTNHPYFKVYGGDVSAGGSFQFNTNPCTGSGGIRAYANPNSATATRSGASTEYAAFALSAIDQFYSASQRLGAPPQPPPLPDKGLTFANNSASVWGGNFGGGRCLQEYYASTQGVTSPLPSNNVNIAGLATGRYTATGSVIINGGTVPLGRRVTIYVDGNVMIRGNPDGISYQTVGGSDVTQIPFVTIVALGTISFENTVTHSDGWYIAQPKFTGAGVVVANTGVINTCATMADFGAPMSILNLYDNCRTQLRINGAFTANKINLQRSFGTAVQSTVAEPYTANQAGEVVVAGPEMYLAQPNFNTSPPGVIPPPGPPPPPKVILDSISSLPPIF